MMNDRSEVKLTPKSSLALASLVSRDGVSEVDAINRALQLTDFLDMSRAYGKRLALISPDGTVETVDYE